MDAGGDGGRAGAIDVILASIAAVSWALVGMAGAAALGLHLLGADAAGGLVPMTAAVVVLGVGGSVTPSGDVSAFGLEGAAVETAVDFTPLGVSLTGALFLAYFFLRSLRRAGPYVSGTELAARVLVLVTLFLAVVAGLAWAGNDVVTIDGSAWGVDEIPGAGGIGDIDVGGIGDIGDIGGLLPDRVGDLVEAEASVGFSVNAVESLAGALFWVLGVVLIALLAARRAPLPPGRVGDAVRRAARPAASALVTVVLVAVVAGYAAAGYAALGDEHPRRVVGAALLGAPNGVGLGVPLGLFVPWRGSARGSLAEVLPDPLGALVRGSVERPVTVGRLAELDEGVWLLAVAAAVTMLAAGVLAAARTPRAGLEAVAFARRCGVRLSVAAALALPLPVVLSGVSVDASLAVLGIDAFDAGIELHGDVGAALLLGAVWGAGAGGLGALLACATGVAGGRERRYGDATPTPTPAPARAPGPYRPPGAGTRPYGSEQGGGGLHSAPTQAGHPGLWAPPPPPPPPPPPSAGPPGPRPGPPGPAGPAGPPPGGSGRGSS
ncbi:streptophobe family protein [Streptomyces sp. NPDC059567]|uniref:streptophobe family protein n=1 Tax=Streptomyces sp. NPDC059567 TaxID=3346867 RepID=UPI0036931645